MMSFPPNESLFKMKKGRYVSCCRKAPNGAALAEYRGSIGAFEFFLFGTQRRQEDLFVSVT
jgi:hypothetical protein